MPLNREPTFIVVIGVHLGIPNRGRKVERIRVAIVGGILAPSRLCCWNAAIPSTGEGPISGPILRVAFWDPLKSIAA